MDDDTNNTLFGTAENDILAGQGGDDLLAGLAGDDRLDGGTGNDQMEGGPGNDTYVVDSLEDTITELPDEGEADTIETNLTYDLSRPELPAVENLTLTGNSILDGFGNDLDNIITGNDSRNRLVGGVGNDTLIGNGGDDQIEGGLGGDQMQGGLGSDVYLIDDTADTVVEAENAGTDQVHTTVSFTLGDNVEILFLEESDALDGTGNAINNTITGNSSNNVLRGEAGNDVLIGKDGNDVLDGGSGDDEMQGGSGSDVYIVDSSGDVVIELETSPLAIAGSLIGRPDVIEQSTDLPVLPGFDFNFDEVRSTVSFTLTNELEGLTLLGTDSIDGTGNNKGNDIRGNGAANLLVGNGGADFIRGRQGDDTLLGGDGADFLQGGQGDDLLSGEASGDFLIGGDGADQLNGNKGRDFLSGGRGADRLNGGAGRDRLNGGRGIDRLRGGADEDVFVLGRNRDREVILDFAAGVDRFRIATGFGDGSERTFDDLTLLQQGTNTIIELDDVAIALVRDINVSDLTAADFVFRSF